MGVNHVPPAGCMVLLANRAKNIRIIHPWLRETVAVDGDTIDACDHAAQVFVVLVQLGREYQHGMVQGELGSRGSFLPQAFNTLRNPVLLLCVARGGDGTSN